MVPKIASEPLRVFFAGELKDDENATLLTARNSLEAIKESGPQDDRVAQIDEWLLETEELIRIHGGHCSLKEMIYP